MRLERCAGIAETPWLPCVTSLEPHSVMQLGVFPTKDCLLFQKAGGQAWLLGDVLEFLFEKACYIAHSINRYAKWPQEKEVMPSRSDMLPGSHHMSLGHDQPLDHMEILGTAATHSSSC